MIFNNQSGGGNAGVEIIAEEKIFSAPDVGVTIEFDKPASYVCIGFIGRESAYVRLLPGENFGDNLWANFSEDGTSLYLACERSNVTYGWTAFG